MKYESVKGAVVSIDRAYHVPYDLVFPTNFLTTRSNASGVLCNTLEKHLQKNNVMFRTPVVDSAAVCGTSFK